MRLEVLGPLRVVTGRGVLTARDFRRAKPKQLLEVLVLERGHAVSKERLAEALWGEQVPRNAAATLETYVSVLRQELEPGATPRTSVVRTEPGGYELHLERVEVDLDDFDRALAQAAVAEPQAALRLLHGALALVRGSVLEDEPYAAWAQAARAQYADKQVQALVHAGRLSLLTGDPAAARVLAERAVALNPLAEPAYQVQMAAAYSQFRQDEALAAFDRCRRLLADELGVDPHDETVALHLSILRHEDITGLVPVPVPVPEPASTGEHGPHRLPLRGREADLEVLRAAAARAAGGAFTVAMVTGPQGVGKTRLVEALGERVDLRLACNRCSDLEASFPYLALSLALTDALATSAADGLPGLRLLLDRVVRDQQIDSLARLMVMEDLAVTLLEQPPLLIVLDDAQWADEDSLTTLGYLARRARAARVLVVLTCVSATSGSAALRALRPDLRLDLHELGEADVRQLAGPDCWAVTGGNPSYVASWLEARARGLAEEFTPELRERVLSECWDAGPSAFRLLSTAAALDDRAPSVELLAFLLDVRQHVVVEQFDELVARQLVAPAGDGIAVRSPAVRAILRGTQSSARRELLRRAAASFGDTPRRRATDHPGTTAAGASTDDLAGRRRSADRVLDLDAGRGAEVAGRDSR